MKALLAVTSIIFLSFAADDSTDRLGVKGPLTFNDTSFSLVWTSHPTDNYFIQEYVPAGEDVNHFNQLLSIFVVETDLAPTEVAITKIQELKERKKTDSSCHYELHKGPNENEPVLDFLMGESTDNHMTIVEFNVYRYKQVRLSKDRKGVLLYAYSKRAYGGDITPFMSDLVDSRRGYVDQILKTEIPEIKIVKE